MFDALCTSRGNQPASQTQTGARGKKSGAMGSGRHEQVVRRDSRLPDAAPHTESAFPNLQPQQVFIIFVGFKVV